MQLDVSIKESKNTCQNVKQDGKHDIPKYEITVDSNLNYSFRAFCWQLPDGNFLLKSHEGSMQSVTPSKLVKEINDSVFCPGLCLKSNSKCSNSDVKLCEIQKLPLTNTQHIKPLSQDEYVNLIQHLKMENAIEKRKNRLSVSWKESQSNACLHCLFKFNKDRSLVCLDQLDLGK